MHVNTSTVHRPTVIVVHLPSQNCLLQAINDKIMSMNLTGAVAEPTSVDAQYSLQGGVTVLVTGRITYPVSSMLGNQLSSGPF